MKSLIRASTVMLALVTTVGIAAAQQTPQIGPGAQPQTGPGATTTQRPELRLTPAQRTSMYRMVMQEKKFKPAPAGTTLRVGAKIPSEVELNDLPRNLEPELAGTREFKYVVVGNQIALIDPKTNEVVEIIQQ